MRICATEKNAGGFKKNAFGHKTGRCTKFRLRTTPRFSCVCGAFTDNFWACPAVEEFAEWLRRNLRIPDQEYVDSLILLLYNIVDYILSILPRKFQIQEVLVWTK